MVGRNVKKIWICIIINHLVFVIIFYVSISINRRKFLGLSLGLVGSAVFYEGYRLNESTGAVIENSQISNNSTPVNLNWPDTQLMPTFNAPLSLDVATLVGMPEDQQVMFSTLQGLVNRIDPQIYLLQDDEEGRLTWLEELGTPYRFFSSPWDLFEVHKDVLRGMVVYDEDMLDTINVATTFSPIYSSIVVSPKLVKEVQSYTSLPVRLSLAGRYNSAIEAYSLSYSQWKKSVSRRIIVGISPQVAVSLPPVDQNPFFGEIGIGEMSIEGPFSYVANPFLRDYCVAVNAFCFWLDPLNASQNELFGNIISDQEPNSLYMGWFANGSNGGENAGVELCSKNQLRTVASDYCTNLTVFSGISASITPQKMPAVPSLSNDIYITITFTEGDNLQYNEHRLRVIFDDSDRGSIAMNYSIEPLLIEAAPNILKYYLSASTANDCLVAGPSGAGYIFPGSWPESNLTDYLQISAGYLNSIGVNVVNVLNHPQGQYIPLTAQEGLQYESIVNPIGILADWSKINSVTTLGNNLPAVTGLLASDTVELSLILNEILNSNVATPAFYSIGVIAWNILPTDVVQTLNSIPANSFNVVRADVFFALLRQHLGLSQWV